MRVVLVTGWEKKLGPHLKKTLGGIAESVRKDAANIVPVDSGALQNSLFSQVADDGLTAIVGATQDYAAFVELGTSQQVAQPYLRPAVLKRRG